MSFSPRPQPPAHLNAHAVTLTGQARQSLPRSPYRTRTMPPRPSLPVPLFRYGRMRWRESLAGWDVAVRIEESMTVVTHTSMACQAPPPRTSQAHPPSDAPLRSTGVLAAGADDIVPPCMHVFRREGACLSVSNSWPLPRIWLGLARAAATQGSKRHK